ncbi:hypothetical protein KDW55_26710 [Burkholderia sp. AU19243]|uniref:hypothetical protein n=1 Tax=Burkholderia sp. AU19243 TaxID=2824810 RepID=UPI001B8F433C|nr:hypothetical protein [Burkholderia sp. AU19243]MBR8366917.1 hypothetical protein [Burkholderia sp. AU19243]
MAGNNGPFVLPQYQGNLYDIQRQQMLAEALMRGAMTSQQTPAGAAVGPYQVQARTSPLAPLSQLGQAYLAAKLGNQVSQGLNGLGQAQMNWAMGGSPMFGAQSPQQSALAEQPVGNGTAGAQPATVNDQSDGAAGLLGGMIGSPTGALPQLQGQSTAQQGALAPGGSLNPAGWPIQMAAMRFFSDPGGYWKDQAAALAPTDQIKNNRWMGVSPEQASANYQNEATKNASLTGRWGYATPDGRGGFAPTVVPTQIAGAQLTTPNGGKTWAYNPIPGGAEALQQESGAKAAGQAQFNVRPAFGPDGRPVWNTDFNIANGLSSPGQPGGGALGGARINAGRFGNYQAPNGGPTVPGLAPGVAGAAEKVAGANADRYNQAVQFGVDSPTRQNVLDNIIQLSQSGVQTGPGSDWQNNVKGVIANSPVLGKMFPNWQGSVGEYQELKKYLNQNGLRAWQAAGGTGTDSQMEAAMHANPNDTMFPQALQTMAAWAKAGELAGTARANFYQQFKQNNGGVANLDQADQTWRNNFDPKVFQLQTYSPQQRQQLLNSLSPQQAQQLMQRRAWFKQNGLLQ